MVALQIRDVPEDVRDTLAARARRSGQSLQGYLLELVTREAAFARNAELLRRFGSWTDGTGLTGDDVLEALDAARAAQAGPA